MKTYKKNKNMRKMKGGNLLKEHYIFKYLYIRS